VTEPIIFPQWQIGLTAIRIAIQLQKPVCINSHAWRETKTVQHFEPLLYVWHTPTQNVEVQIQANYTSYLVRPELFSVLMAVANKQKLVLQ
jgi:hypothetical protein